MIHLLTWACEHIEPCYNCYMHSDGRAL